MCGIAGIAGASDWSYEVLQARARAMADTMTHRGPDDHGVWVDAQHSVALAHRRLSIQDLSAAGHQPMVSVTGRYYIVFNGEIYNFQDIGDELKSLGYTFKGHSDTEVLLTAFEEWGVESAIRRSFGMFAMAVWDKESKELILCRDRMGEKPLFFGWTKNRFVFASELKALQEVFWETLEVDYNTLAAFFRFGYVPTPYSIYKDIFKLQPGAVMRVPLTAFISGADFSPLPDDHLFSPKKYWNLDEIARAGQNVLIRNEQEALEQFDQLLRDVIDKQKIADVPIGAFLSGGVDSSLVAAIMQAVSGSPIKTFTIGFNEKEFDEAPYARAVAKHIGSEHHEQYVSADDGLALIDDLPKYWDEPFADSSQIPSLIVARKARESVTVCLTGDGGDELFCGYNRYISTFRIWQKLQRVPLSVRKSFAKMLCRVSPSAWSRGYSLLKRLQMNDDTQANVGLKVHKLAGVLKTESLSAAYHYLMSYWHNPADLLQFNKEALSVLDYNRQPGMDSFIHDAMYWDQQGYLVDDNLVKGDRSSMAWSLETRLPLLDHRIVEFSWRLPVDLKYRHGKSKWILRQLLYRYVPKSLIERPKMGFSVPVGDWLRGPLKEWGADLLFATGAKGSEMLDNKVILQTWQEHQACRYDHSHKLWTLLMWLAWARS